MRLPHLLALVSAAMLFQPSHVSGAVTGWTDVVVRLYDANSVVRGTNGAALDLAAKALSGASIDIVWRVCPNVRPIAAPCDLPLGPDELAIRIVRSEVPDGYRGLLPLGDALVDTRSATAVLATIYFDRVRWLASQAGTDVQTLLGRAIAHELGHLLLATNTHGPVGLMRASWSRDEVRRGSTRDWSFMPSELASMRRRVDALVSR